MSRMIRENLAMSILRRISNLLSREKLEQEIQDEFRSHIDMRTTQNIAAGMNPEQARRDALVRFGNPTLMKEKVVAQDAALTFESLGADVRYSFRQLLRNREF